MTKYPRQGASQWACLVRKRNWWQVVRGIGSVTDWRSVHGETSDFGGGIQVKNPGDIFRGVLWAFSLVPSLMLAGFYVGGDLVREERWVCRPAEMVVTADDLRDR